MIRLRLNITVVVPFSRLPVLKSTFWCVSISGITWFFSHVSITKWRPVESSISPIIASELAIRVPLLKPIPVHLLRLLVCMMNSIESVDSKYCH